MVLLRTVALAAAVAVISLQAFAQTQAINGSIRGRVTDTTDTSVPLAKVDILNTATGFARTTESNSDGYFVVPNLPIGSYVVTVQKTGFDTQRHTGIVLDAGTEAVIDAQLKVGSVTTTVEVYRRRARPGADARLHGTHHRSGGDRQPAADFPQPVQFRDLSSPD